MYIETKDYMIERTVADGLIGIPVSTPPFIFAFFAMESRMTSDVSTAKGRFVELIFLAFLRAH